MRNTPASGQKIQISTCRSRAQTQSAHRRTPEPPTASTAPKHTPSSRPLTRAGHEHPRTRFPRARFHPNDMRLYAGRARCHTKRLRPLPTRPRPPNTHLTSGVGTGPRTSVGRPPARPTCGKRGSRERVCGAFLFAPFFLSNPPHTATRAARAGRRARAARDPGRADWDAPPMLTSRVIFASTTLVVLSCAFPNLFALPSCSLYHRGKAKKQEEQPRSLHRFVGKVCVLFDTAKDSPFRWRG